jgi:hypothetical protein
VIAATKFRGRQIVPPTAARFAVVRWSSIVCAASGLIEFGGSKYSSQSRTKRRR